MPCLVIVLVMIGGGVGGDQINPKPWKLSVNIIEVLKIVPMGKTSNSYSFTLIFSKFDWLQTFSMVEDVADWLDDLICAWDKVVGTDVETVVVLLLGRVLHKNKSSQCQNSRLACFWWRHLPNLPSYLLHPGNSRCRRCLFFHTIPHPSLPRLINPLLPSLPWPCPVPVSSLPPQPSSSCWLWPGLCHLCQYLPGVCLHPGWGQGGHA